MTTFIYPCPNTGQKVQGRTDDPPVADDPEAYQSVQCIACSCTHWVNPRTGRVLERQAILRAAKFAGGTTARRRMFPPPSQSTIPRPIARFVHGDPSEPLVAEGGKWSELRFFYRFSFGDKSLVGQASTCRRSAENKPQQHGLKRTCFCAVRP
jgi:hypothetical protein